MDIVVAVVPSMDGAGAIVVSPVGVVIVPPAPVHHPKRVDRATTGYYNGDEEGIQVLLLSSTPIDITENSEYNKRKDSALKYKNEVAQLECFGTLSTRVSFPMIQTVGDVKDRVSGRQRIDVILKYKGTSNRRYVWLPVGVTITNTRGDAKKMHAIGCTCRDMLWRGASEARSGCKHMIAWNMFMEEDGIHIT